RIVVVELLQETGLQMSCELLLILWTTILHAGCIVMAVVAVYSISPNAKAMRMAEERSLRIGSVIYSTFYSL
ncbi:MAG: hypothetical protein ACH350_10325, partial [Parachlamydiaceae bacterium]